MDKAIGQLKDMLSTEEGQKELENIIGGVQETQQGYNLPSNKTNSNPFNMDAIMKIKGVMDSMQMGDDPRVNLMSALRPYISKSRGNHIDSAIKIMSLGKLPYLLKNMKK